MDGPSSRLNAFEAGPQKVANRKDSEADSEPDAAGDIKTHFRVCRFVMETGVKLALRSVPVATACVLYHRFFQHVSLAAYEPYLVAMSCLYLAGKIEEQHLRTRDIINVSHRYFHPGSAPLECDKDFWDLRDSVVQCELLHPAAAQLLLPASLPDLSQVAGEPPRLVAHPRGRNFLGFAEGLLPWKHVHPPYTPTHRHSNTLPGTEQLRRGAACGGKRVVAGAL
ncbi:unnamed protein product [Tetraodon nigroviridis]|uniref:(spotted green pufferfish) hypothetical protein n=1 Tax=Tetraodon nigroviridis TaxID=99883 RepID=Q4SUN1_TETNG|nr:unnamed protein product [Tetraodon nigroviridis]